jgi:acetyl esterase/lipase
VLTALFVCGVAMWADAQRIGPRDVDRLPSKPADARVWYGANPLQFGDLRLPNGRGPFPLVVVIHGGCWVASIATLQNSAALADGLRDAGLATWNIEYRRLGDDGAGWPGTFEDVAAAADYARTLAKTYPIDLSRVVTTGHSAGAPLALWLAARARLPASSPLRGSDPIGIKGVAALGGPGDLADFARYDADICGTRVIERLLGGARQSVPDRYAQVSPIELLPLRARQLFIVGADDPVMPAGSRDAYVAAARKAGDRADVVVIPGAGHFEVIAPTAAAFAIVRNKIIELAKQ